LFLKKYNLILYSSTVVIILFQILQMLMLFISYFIYDIIENHFFLALSSYIFSSILCSSMLSYSWKHLPFSLYCPYLQYTNTYYVSCVYTLFSYPRSYTLGHSGGQTTTRGKKNIFTNKIINIIIKIKLFHLKNNLIL